MVRPSNRYAYSHTQTLQNQTNSYALKYEYLILILHMFKCLNKEYGI